MPAVQPHDAEYGGETERQYGIVGTWIEHRACERAGPATWSDHPNGDEGRHQTVAPRGKEGGKDPGSGSA
jgi:hypothetical protein